MDIDNRPEVKFAKKVVKYFNKHMLERIDLDKVTLEIGRDDKVDGVSRNKHYNAL